jgi:hypothetical protein
MALFFGPSACGHAPLEESRTTMRPLTNDPDKDSGDASAVRRAAAPEPAADDEGEPRAEREPPMPEEDGYGYGV